MENTSRTPLTVNCTGLGVRPTGAGAYGRFCAQAARELFDARVLETPAWIERIPSCLVSPLRYAASALLFARVRGVIYNPTYRTVPGRRGQIVSVLDLIPVHFPATKPLMTRYFTAVLPRVIAAGRGVITLSEAMRGEVAAYYGMDASRIHVVPPGIDTAVFRPAAETRGAEPYLLSVGTALAHKNIEEILRNAALWAPRRRLLLAGVLPGCARRLRRVAARAGVGRRVEILPYVDRAQLAALYRECDALLYPSRCEGFGIPPLEAFACGAPAVVSDIPVHREVCGAAALYVTPGDGRGWAQALAALDDPGRLEQLRGEGQRRVARYSWDHTRERLRSALSALMRPDVAAPRR